jgi:hypothetical protein
MVLQGLFGRTQNIFSIALFSLLCYNSAENEYGSLAG